MKRARLEEFPQVAYKYLGKAKDATFELTDAILLTSNVYSLADLSLSPVFRRLNEPTTWGEAASVFEVDDPILKRVRVSLWKNLHFCKAVTRPI